MGGKYKKFLRSEKAKVKLKGVKLPKGLNVTKTEFKVKKIIIKEQLQEERFESGKKKHNVKEVLSRLKHHNTSFRTDALKNLRECLLYNSDEIIRNIGQIVQGISMLSLDIEKDVRRESFKVFTEMLKNFHSDALQPFFNIISSYLKCAMSHINASIQEDSLLFLDVLLTYLPNLIMQNHSQIFSNFINMISKLRVESKPGRMLTINLGSKSTSIKWRSKVLDRLQRMLHIIVHDWKLKTNAKSMIENIPKTFVLKDQSPYLSLCYTPNSVEHLDNIFSFSIGRGDVEELDNGEKTKKYISYLFPLLIESWREVKPNFTEGDSFKSQIVLSSEAALTLKNILEILECLWEMVEIWEANLNIDFSLSLWFKQKFSSEFATQILCNFPYQQFDGEKSKDKKKTKEILKNIQISGGLYCSKQNLTLVHLYTIFYGSNIVKCKEFSKAVLQYMNSITENFHISSEYLQSFEKALRSVLFVNGKYFIKVDETKCKSLLRTVIEKYRKDKYSKNFSPNILTLICDIVLSKDDLLSVYGSNEFCSWLPLLPLSLSKEIVSERVLRTLTNLGKQKNSLFLKSLSEQVGNVIENIENIQVAECTNAFEGKKLIMNLFYWIDFWNEQTQNILIEKINKNITNIDISNYFKFIIKKTFPVNFDV